MLITDSTAENSVRRGPRYFRKLLNCVDGATGDLDYNEYLRSLDFIISPKDHVVKLSQIERNAVYLLWRLDFVVRAYRPVWDWVVEDRLRLGIDPTRCVNQVLKLSHTDLRRGRINDATKRTMTYLSTVLFKEFNASKYLRWKSSDHNEQAPLIINIRPTSTGEGYTISRNEINKLFSLAADILVAANDQNSIKYLLDKGAIAPSPEVFENIIQGLIEQGNMVDASRYLEMLDAIDPHSPKTGKIKQEISRSKKIISLVRSTGRSFREVQEMAGIDFEDLIIRVFRDAGYATQSTPRSGDYGADAIIETSSGTRIVVQCKRYKSRLNLKAVQEVISAMSHYSADFGIVITTNGYLKSAVELAKSADIELWGQDEVIDFLAGNLRFSSIPDL